MNNRDYKQFGQGTISHIYNRGNGKMTIFKDEQDFYNFRKRMILLLNPTLMSTVPVDKQRIRLKPMPADCFDLLYYCLMPTHFHIALYQNSELSPEKFISSLCSSYGKYYNKKYGHVGGLYQDQFKATLVESDEQLLWLRDYIHNNPVRAGLVEKPEDYEWSSYREYAGMTNIRICNLLGTVNGAH